MRASPNSEPIPSSSLASPRLGPGLASPRLGPGLASPRLGPGLAVALACALAGCATPGGRRTNEGPAAGDRATSGAEADATDTGTTGAGPEIDAADGAATGNSPSGVDWDALDPADPLSLVVPCLPDDRSIESLELALDQAFDRHDARCWAALDVALGHEILARAALIADGPRLAAYRFRQAAIRAARHGHDDLAAVAYAGRGLLSLSLGEVEPALYHQGRALQSAAVHAAATGEAPPALDALFLERMIEALAEWERTDRADLFEEAAAMSSRLKGREALRLFVAAGHGPVALAGAARAHDAVERLGALAERTARLRESWGRPSRQQAPERLMEAEAIVESGAAWTARAPLLLEWLPGGLPLTAGAARSVMVPREVLLDYTVGEDHGVLLILWEAGFAATPLAGRAELQAAADACTAGDCQPLATAVLGPAARHLEGADRVLVAAHGLLHQVDFEAMLQGREVERTPSILGFTGLRLRAWGQGLAVHPGAARLLPEGAVEDPVFPPVAEAAPVAPQGDLPDEAADAGASAEVAEVAPEAPQGDLPDEAAESPPPDRAAWLLGLGAPTGPLPKVSSPLTESAIPVLRAACAEGRTLVRWRTPGAPKGGRLFGAPLTLPEQFEAPD